MPMFWATSELEEPGRMPVLGHQADARGDAAAGPAATGPRRRRTAAHARQRAEQRPQQLVRPLPTSPTRPTDLAGVQRQVDPATRARPLRLGSGTPMPVASNRAYVAALRTAVGGSAVRTEVLMPATARPRATTPGPATDSCGAASSTGPPAPLSARPSISPMSFRGQSTYRAAPRPGGRCARHSDRPATLRHLRQPVRDVDAAHTLAAQRSDHVQDPLRLRAVQAMPSARPAAAPEAAGRAARAIATSWRRPGDSSRPAAGRPRRARRARATGSLRRRAGQSTRPSGPPGRAPTSTFSAIGELRMERCLLRDQTDPRASASRRDANGGGPAVDPR